MALKFPRFWRIWGFRYWLKDVFIWKSYKKKTRASVCGSLSNQLPKPLVGLGAIGCWGRREKGAWSPIWGFHWSGRGSRSWIIFCCFPRCVKRAEWGVEQQGLQSVLLGDASVSRQWLPLLSDNAVPWGSDSWFRAVQTVVFIRRWGFW